MMAFLCPCCPRAKPDSLRRLPWPLQPDSCVPCQAVTLPQHLHSSRLALSGLPSPTCSSCHSPLGQPCSCQRPTASPDPSPTCSGTVLGIPSQASALNPHSHPGDRRRAVSILQPGGQGAPADGWAVSRPRQDPSLWGLSLLTAAHHGHVPHEDGPSYSTLEPSLQGRFPGCFPSETSQDHEPDLSICCLRGLSCARLWRQVSWACHRGRAPGHLPSEGARLPPSRSFQPQERSCRQMC